MPLTIPTLDDRRYQDLVDEALARIPVHNPEWTNFNKSDPGVTLVEVFAFLTENLLYRSNQIPERNRLKFLSLLGVPLQPASSAQGLVVFTNERGPLRTITLNQGIEVLAGKVPFRTDSGLDVLPVEARVYIKKKMPTPTADVLAYYQQLYASALIPDPTGQSPDPLIYQAVPLISPDDNGIDLGRDTVDGAIWVALLARQGEQDLDTIRKEIGGKTLNLGMVPALTDAGRRLPPGSRNQGQGISLIDFSIPKVADNGGLPPDGQPRYVKLDASSKDDVLSSPGVVQIVLPTASELKMWTDVDPLQAGLDQFPPALQDTKLEQRVVTWLRVQPSAAASARILWVGINAALVSQRAHIANELLPRGTGEPDQNVNVANTPIVPGSVSLKVTVLNETTKWQEVDDLMSAGPEVPTPDLRLPPGVPQSLSLPVDAFTVNAESGEIRFGDGLHGRRPSFDAVLRVDYDYGVGGAGNVNAGSINAGPALPPGLKVSNPVRTWGGADSETVDEGQKQIPRYLQHRDRLVTTEDFKTITQRTPGIDLARVDVLPAYNPELAPSQPGDSAGSVTLMVIPKYDPVQPESPLPDRNFLNAICSYLDPRRLVTTEVFLRPPSYQPIWVSAGISVVAGESIGVVRERVKQAITDFLSPLPGRPGNANGWPLFKPVLQLELVSVVSRVPGVLLVNGLLLAGGTGPSVPKVDMAGLALPQLAGVAVSIGDPSNLDQIRGTAAPSPLPKRVLPIPAVPEGC